MKSFIRNKSENNHKIMIKTHSKKFLLMFIIIISLLTTSSCDKDNCFATTGRGIISVNQFNLQTGTIPLDTEWEFYFEKLYFPPDFSGRKPLLTGYIKIPGTWNSFNTGQKILTGDGYATFRLVIRNVPRGSYALKIPSMATAYRMWINETEVSSNGVVAPDETMIPMQKPCVAFFNTEGGEVAVLVQVSNYMSDKGGIWDNIFFGERNSVLKKRETSVCLDMALFGAFIIMSLYHFGLYFFRKKNDFTLYFGLVCFIIALRVILTGEFLIVYFFPSINWTLQIKTEFLTVFGGFTFFIIFLSKLFNDEFSAGVVKFYIIAGIMFSLVSIIFPVKISAHFMPLYHLLVIAGFIIILISLMKAVKNNKNGALYIFAGSIVLIITLINDILDSNGIINTVYLFQYGLLIFIFSQSVILAKIFSGSFSRVEELSMQLEVSYRQINEYNRNLEQKISERTSELETANKKLHELNRAKTDFFANISHELRTPLTLILAPIEDAISGKELNKEVLYMIYRSAINLLSLINNLLEISRLTSGKMKLAVSETDISYLVRKRCVEMESSARLKGIILSCNTPSEPVKAFVDREKGRHLLSNFFSNSFKFTEPGGRIDISVFAENNQCVIKFSDNGCGIPESEIDTIFDRFTRGDSDLNRKHEGTGIGLSIVKELVRLHGGEVCVESRDIKSYPINHGTTFIVRLPLEREHFYGREDVEFLDSDFSREDENIPYVIYENITTTPAESTVAFQTDEDSFSVLVVEDNTDLRGFLTGLLREKFFVHEASNGEEAIRLLEQNEDVDLVLSDIMMPGINGHDLLRHIRADKRFKGLPVILLTARADTIMKIEGLGIGATDYVTKPFNSRELFLRISNQMELKRLRNSAERNYNNLIEKLKAVKSKPLSDENASKIENICIFIQENYAHELYRHDLASATGMNPDTFSRLFNQYTGSTLSDYICNIRITNAMLKLTSTEDTITRISIDTGFDNIRTFNRVFRRLKGMSPGEYRELYKLKN